MYPFYDFSALLEPENILVYLRKSRSDDPLLSVEEVLQKHESLLNDWAEKNLSASIPEENRFREIVSGETIADRPEVKKVLRLIESPKIKAVLVVEVQRLSRGDLEDAGRLIKLLRYTDTLVITPMKTYNLQDDYDRDAFERELKRGNEYLEYQKKIMNRGRLLSVSQGNYIGSCPPYGYRKVWITDGKRKSPTLQENKQEADVVRMIFELYVNQDMGRHNICHHLDSLGIKPPRGEHWSPAALREMLSNIHYIGKVKWNWRKVVTTVEDSEIVKTRPKAKTGEYLVYDGKHDAIISEQLFYAAQEKIGKNHRNKPNTTIRNPLAGLLFCKKCGRAMSLRTYKDKFGNERSAPRLICDGQTYCRSGSCLFDDVVERVSSILQESIDNFYLQIKNQNEAIVKTHARLIENLQQQLKELEAKELSMWESQSHPDPAQRMPSAVFQQLNKKLLQEKREVQQSLRSAYETMPNPTYLQEKIKKFEDAVAALHNPNMTAAKKNQLLRSCVERITYERQKPERLQSRKGKKNVIPLPVGSSWSDPPISLQIKLKI